MQDKRHISKFDDFHRRIQGRAGAEDSFCSGSGG